jgi:hypothetical protein
MRERSGSKPPQFVRLYRDRVLGAADVHRGRLRRGDLAHYGALGARAGHLDIDGHVTGGEGNQALAGRATYQRGLVGVDQRVVDQLGEFGVYVPPREGVHCRPDQLGGHWFLIVRQPPELLFKLVVWLVHVSFS